MPDCRVWPIILVLRSRPHCLWGGAGWRVPTCRWMAGWRCRLDIRSSLEMRNILGIEIVYVLGTSFGCIGICWALILGEWLIEFIFCINANFIFWECQIVHCSLWRYVIYMSIISLLLWKEFPFWFATRFRNLESEWFVCMCDILAAEPYGKLNVCIFAIHLILPLARRSRIRSALHALTRSGVATLVKKISTNCLKALKHFVYLKIEDFTGKSPIGLRTTDEVPIARCRWERSSRCVFFSLFFVI